MRMIVDGLRTDAVALTADERRGRRPVVFVRSLNLTNRQYEETLRYPAIRRSGSVGVRVATG